MKTNKLFVLLSIFTFCCNIIGMQPLFPLINIDISKNICSKTADLHTSINFLSTCKSLRSILLEQHETKDILKCISHFIIGTPIFSSLNTKQYSTVVDIITCDNNGTIATNIKKLHEKTLKLESAVKNNNLKKVEKLLSLGAHCNYRNSLKTQELPLLHIACENGNVEIAELLLEHGALINEVSYRGETCLFKAVNVQRYSYNNTVNTTDQTSQLNEENERALLTLLIKHGIDINKVNSSNQLALEKACFEGNITTVRFLIDNGALANHDCITTASQVMTANTNKIRALCAQHITPELKQKQYNEGFVITTLLCGLFTYMTALPTMDEQATLSDWANNPALLNAGAFVILAQKIPTAIQVIRNFIIRHAFRRR